MAAWHPTATVTPIARSKMSRSASVARAKPMSPTVPPATSCACAARSVRTYPQRDLQQLIVKSIETEDIRDENGIPFQVFYGISGNSHAFWSIANARKIIGYAPEDNSELRFHEQVAAHFRAAQTKA